MNLKRTLGLKIFFACLIAIVALTIPGLIIKQLDVLADQPLYRHLIRSSITGLIAIVGIWLLRTKLDVKTSISIGLVKPKKALAQFLFGFGLIAVPLIITILLSVVFGWVEISINISNGVLFAIILGLISTFFTDAITEELIFRGFIFSNLNIRYNTWTSSILTLILFVIVPVLISIIQNSIGVNWGVPLTGGYVFTLIFFGAFVQYLRVLTKSIWTGVGFHLFFVQMNQLMGLEGDKLIQFSETSNERPIQITLIVLLLLVFIVLIAYPYFKKRTLR